MNLLNPINLLDKTVIYSYLYVNSYDYIYLLIVDSKLHYFSYFHLYDVYETMVISNICNIVQTNVYVKL